MVTPVPVKTEAVPLFENVTVPIFVLTLNTELVIDTLAVFPALPKIPNTYPATAANAMSVAATMRTVATMGEIPRLSETCNLGFMSAVLMASELILLMEL